MVDYASCSGNTGNATIEGEADGVTVEVPCETDEFVLTHSGFSLLAGVYMPFVALTADLDAPNGSPGDVAPGVTYTFARIDTDDTTDIGVQVDLICCPR